MAEPFFPIVYKLIDTHAHRVLVFEHGETDRIWLNSQIAAGERDGFRIVSLSPVTDAEGLVWVYLTMARPASALATVN